ncbi:hypothetical protein SAMCFNEI73_Ch0805 [Sinorhizobium americanum]|uniref:Uncharacterized protein n=1 Tax=Sinorhizobium americanum TaxID=194963 RepID=A0A1L3LJ66_9HYPH|nr:hypothetical protein SAMCCGM7_Ch0807 [Sinorhizobium americanum CCGM7]APG90128.1 hypothetical protein SAMCFNEI73_Ch0805 [Sinorhizobium americanum]
MCGIPPAAGLDGGCLNRNQVRCKSISFKMQSKKLRARAAAGQGHHRQSPSVA